MRTIRSPRGDDIGHCSVQAKEGDLLEVCYYSIGSLVVSSREKNNVQWGKVARFSKCRSLTGIVGGVCE